MAVAMRNVGGWRRSVNSRRLGNGLIGSIVVVTCIEADLSVSSQPRIEEGRQDICCQVGKDKHDCKDHSDGQDHGRIQ